MVSWEKKGLDWKVSGDVRPSPNTSFDFSVTISRGDPRRSFFFKFLAARLPVQTPQESSERWILAFPKAQMGKELLQRNRQGIGGPPLFMSPRQDFAAGTQNVKNLVTSGYVDPETLYY